MRICSCLLAWCLLAWCAPAVGSAESPDFFSLKAVSINGEEISFEQYRGSVVLVVNTASRCGFTHQYSELQQLYDQYRSKKFIVLAFPSNDFGSQEPGENEEILATCRSKYGVTFPLFAKAPVSGATKQQVYRFLTERGPEELRGEVSWNFEKFLIGKDGTIRRRFGSFTGPASSELAIAIDELLAE